MCSTIASSGRAGTGQDRRRARDPADRHDEGRDRATDQDDEPAGFPGQHEGESRWTDGRCGSASWCSMPLSDTWTLHDCRRTCRTLMDRLGFNEAIAEAGDRTRSRRRDRALCAGSEMAGAGRRFRACQRPCRTPDRPGVKIILRRFRPVKPLIAGPIFPTGKRKICVYPYISMA